MNQQCNHRWRKLFVYTGGFVLFFHLGWECCDCKEFYKPEDFLSDKPRGVVLEISHRVVVPHGRPVTSADGARWVEQIIDEEGKRIIIRPDREEEK